MGSLRTIFAITVVFAHSPWNHGFVFVGGRNAVQLFYMISGFLIFHVVNTNDIYRNPLKFYLNRVLRIYPIYYAVALVTLLAAVIANPNFFEVYRNSPTAADILLIFSNLFIFGQDWVMFSAVNHGQIAFASDFWKSDVLLFKGLLIPQAWTLGLELSFYALAPFILRSRKIIFLLLVFSLLVRAVLISIGIGTRDPWTHRFFPAELSFFLLGALSNQYLLPMWKRLISSNELGWAPKAGTYLIMFLSTIYFLIPVQELFKTLFLFLVFFALLPLTFLYQSASKIDKAIGELSYPIYIGHLLVVMTMHTAVIKYHLSGDFLVSVVNVVAAVIFAHVLNKYIGVPIEQLRAKVKSRG